MRTGWPNVYCPARRIRNPYFTGDPGQTIDEYTLESGACDSDCIHDNGCGLKALFLFYEQSSKE